MTDVWPELIAAAQIIWIDLILSGDNAVVIAMACRGLPESQRRWGIALGAAAAVSLRIVFAVLIIELMHTPFLKLVGGLLLLRIAVNLVTSLGEEAGEHKIKQSDKLWAAVATIALADAVMSLDNVVAVAAIAKDHIGMLVFGLALSIPLIVVGANVLVRLLDRFPILVWAGAGLLGWVSGGMMITDPWVVKLIGPHEAHALETAASTAGAILVLATALFLTRRRKAKREWTGG